jgi:hypothetical protein
VNITFELLDQKMVWLLSYIEESPEETQMTNNPVGSRIFAKQ